MCVLIITTAILFMVLIIGNWEKRRNDKNLEALKIRVNINGVRGKSTATRLITAILWEAGYHAIGKTTGTASRMIFLDNKDERELKRKPRGPSIGEQIRVINKAVKYGANALACECMAVRPEYQNAYQNSIIKANVTVIVNVLEDHLEEMGPTTKQVAEAFALTIPYNGTVVVPDCEFTELFRAVAEERGSQVYVTDENEISDEYLDKFDYRLFKQNCAMALTTARALGIPDEVSFKGMLKAPPDPGALRFYELNSKDKPFLLVNAFAANEPTSSLEIWNIAKEEYPELAKNPIIVMNCRPDRVARTQQFIRGFFSKIPNAILLTVGESTREVARAYKWNKFPNVVEYRDYDGVMPSKVLKDIAPLLEGRIVFCVGNIHGIGGEPLLEAILEYGEYDKKRLKANKKEQLALVTKEKETNKENGEE